MLLDAGVHVIDILHWWLGEPSEVAYQDDACGGLEANARLRLAYAPPEPAAGQIEGTVRLSRDWKTSNTWALEFERASVLWRAGQADRLEIKPSGSPHWLVSQLEDDTPAGRRPALTYTQSFTRQLVDLIDALHENRTPRVSGSEALASLRLIQRCYRERTPLVSDL